MDTKSQLAKIIITWIRFLPLRGRHVWYMKAAKPELCSIIGGRSPKYVIERQYSYKVPSLCNAMHPDLRSHPRAAIIDGESPKRRN